MNVSLEQGGKYLEESITHINCRQINFLQFCRLDFPDEVPQFIQALFEMLTGEDLRKMATPLACDNKISRQL